LWTTQKIFCWKETNMSFVAAAASVGTWAGLTGTAAVIGGGAMIGAGVGGAYSALTGDGKILDSMLTGAGIGGLAGWGLGAAGVGGAAAGTAGSAVPGAGIAGGATTAAETAAVASNTPAVAAASNINPATGLSWEATGSGLSAGAGSPVDPSWWSGLSGMEKLGVGLGATSLLGMLGGQQEGIATQGNKGMIRPYEYTTAKREPAAGESYYFQPIEYDKYGKTTKPLDTSERNYFTQKFTEMPAYAAANGGQVPQLDRMPAGGLAALQGMRDGYGAQQTMDGNIPQFAMGGHLGGYSDGGQLLKGPGDGVSDSIPASINDKQPARLADGEFVIPARIVSELGNGSTDAGAKRLYGMMDRIQADRSKTVGKGKVAVDSKARKHLPA
jgi:hypothetical protein